MKMMGGVCSTHKVMRNSCDIVVGLPKCKNHLEEQGTDGSVILNLY
jgi:hypothetical protein